MAEENQVHVLSEESLRARVGRARESDGWHWAGVGREIEAAFHDGQAVSRRQPPEVGQQTLSASESVQADRVELHDLLADVNRGLCDLEVWLTAVEGMRGVLGRGNKEDIRAPHDTAVVAFAKLKLRLLGMPERSAVDDQA